VTSDACRVTGGKRQQVAGGMWRMAGSRGPSDHEFCITGCAFCRLASFSHFHPSFFTLHPSCSCVLIPSFSLLPAAFILRASSLTLHTSAPCHGSLVIRQPFLHPSSFTLHPSTALFSRPPLQSEIESEIPQRPRPASVFFASSGRCCSAESSRRAGLVCGSFYRPYIPCEDLAALIYFSFYAQVLLWHGHPGHER
jgi:hypothetical protein